MKLILMTLPNFFVEEHKILSALFEEGLDLLHIRKPDTEPVYSERLLTLIPKEFRNRIVVHDHFYLKEEFNLKGIHLNHRNPSPPKGYRGQISCTCHSMDELQMHKKTFNYMFFSPTFPIKAQQSLSISEQLILAKKRGLIDKKVMAFGGITIDNLPIVKDFGFGGAVILRDFWNRFDMHTATDFKNLSNYFRRLKKEAD